MFSSTQPQSARIRGLVRATTFALVIAAAATACDRADATHGTTGKNRTVYGSVARLGNGTARVYVELTDGTPREIGVALSEAAMAGLPTPHSTGGVSMPDGHKMFEQVLTMPETNPTPYRHVLLGWNPGGHEPAGIYDKPHFDFHFYSIGLAERLAISPADAEFAAKGARHPAEVARPAGYVSIPTAVVPFMGAHWVNPASPELNKQDFSQTFLFGSWDGRMIFAEPMITKQFLEARRDFTAAIPVAKAYENAGFYPSSYRIRWDAQAKEYRISLGGFEWRN